MKKTSNIYVAGHNGLVGSHILKELKAQGYTNIITRHVTDLDLRRQADVETFFATERPEYVFLAAAKVGGIHANNTYKASFIYDNLLIASNIIHAAYTYNVKKLLNLGSSCIYPKLAPQPLQESSLLTGSLEQTNEPYAIAKIAAIKLCQYYNEQYNTNFLSVMPTNLYGPHDNFDLKHAHVLPSLIRKFHLAKLLTQKDFKGIETDLLHTPIGGAHLQPKTTSELINILADYGITHETVTLWGTGTPYREFLHAQDLAKAVTFIMQHCNYQDIKPFVNIGTGTDLTIAALAETIKTTVGFSGTITFDAHKPDGTPKKLLDVSRITKLGWKPSINLEQGITQVYTWYIKEKSYEAHTQKRYQKNI